MGLSAEEAMKRIRSGKRLTEEEYDNMRVDEHIKFTKRPIDEGIFPREFVVLVEDLKGYLKAGVTRPDDTVRKARFKPKIQGKGRASHPTLAPIRFASLTRILAGRSTNSIITGSQQTEI